MGNDIDEAIDWRGNAVACDGCVHQTLRRAGRCALQRACVHDRYARRIDRFFDQNPSLANDYVAHPHFEVRAIAARYADLFLLPLLLRDTDETVRWNALRRLPYRYLPRFRDDPHREVRIRVATLLKPTDLAPMIHDADYYVRLVVARRVPEGVLPLMIGDAETAVRRVVASRIDEAWLMRMAADPDPAVRLEIARRLTPLQLLWMRADPDWRVRHEVASRIDRERVGALREDPDPLVREAAAGRLDERVQETA